MSFLLSCSISTLIGVGKGVRGSKRSLIFYHTDGTRSLFRRKPPWQNFCGWIYCIHPRGAVNCGHGAPHKLLNEFTADGLPSQADQRRSSLPALQEAMPLVITVLRKENAIYFIFRILLIGLSDEKMEWAWKTELNDRLIAENLVLEMTSKQRAHDKLNVTILICRFVDMQLTRFKTKLN